MLTIWSPKGGSGASVTAAAVALTLARSTGCRLADLGGDQPAVLGLASEPVTGIAEWLAASPGAGAEALDRLAIEVAPGLALIPRGGPIPPETDGRDHLVAALRRGAPAVVDLGSVPSSLGIALASASDVCLAVVRPCYLALRNAVSHDLLGSTGGVIVVEEPGRSLRAGDIGRVLDQPVVHVIRAEARIARCIDAGSLTARLPEPLSRMAERVLARFPRATDERAA